MLESAGQEQTKEDIGGISMKIFSAGPASAEEAPASDDNKKADEPIEGEVVEEDKK